MYKVLQTSRNTFFGDCPRASSDQPSTGPKITGLANDCATPHVATDKRKPLQAMKNHPINQDVHAFIAIHFVIV